MSLYFGVADEAFKYYTGVLYDSSRRQTRNFPESLWEKYPNHNLVPGGRDLFNQKSISLLSAKNDWAAFQVAVKMESPFLISVSRGLNLSPKRGVCCIRLDGWCEAERVGIKLQIEELVGDSDRSKKADVLTNKDFNEYEAYSVGLVWVELQVPKDAAAGIYCGGVRLYKSMGLGDEELAGEVAFQLEVKNVTLPDKRESNFDLDLWQHNSNIARMYEVARYSDDHFAILENYVASMAELGVKNITIVASDIPWCGQTCHRLDDGSNVYEYNIIDIYKDKNGKFHYDFSKMQRYIELCFKYGIDKWIKVFGLVCVWVDPEYGYGNLTEDYPDAVKLRYWDENDGCMHLMKTGQEIDNYIRALQDYFVEHSLIDKVLLCADEPLDFEYYSNIINRIRKAAPRFRFFAAINHTSHIELSKDCTDSFCFILPSVAEEWEKICEYKNQMDKVFTWYVCCGPSYPNMFLRSNLLETRLVGILTEFLGLDGFLRWNYTVWNPNPRSSLCWHLFPAGDNCFVYPGQDGKPLLSLRYKQLKRAIEDYMLMDMLKKEDEDLAKRVFTEIYSLVFLTQDPKTLVACDKTAETVFCLKYDAFERAKRILLDALEENPNKGGVLS